MGDSNILKIRMLGEFSIEYNGNVINDYGSRSKKLWMLLEYLITFRDRSISQNDLIELLFPDEDMSDPVSALKALIHRVRAQLSRLGVDGKSLISYQRGGYMWNPKGLDVWIDVDEFEKLCQSAGVEPDVKVRLSYLLKALELYKGSFLPQVALETWAVVTGMYYNSKYISALKMAVELLTDELRYEEIISLCQKALLIDPYEEQIHMEFIRALVGSGQIQAALFQCEQVSNLFQTNFGVSVSAEMKSLHDELMTASDVIAEDFSKIKTKLEDSNTSNGAFYSEPKVFKEICQMAVRAQNRSKQRLCLGMLGVTDMHGKPPPVKNQAYLMEKLASAIENSTRKNDMYTKHGTWQYLLLLPDSTPESAEIVFDRIGRRFNVEVPDEGIELVHETQALSAAQDGNKFF